MTSPKGQFPAQDFTVTITETATGRTVDKVIRDYTYGIDNLAFYYTEGNGSCNCNLAIDFDNDRDNGCDGPRIFTAQVSQTSPASA